MADYKEIAFSGAPLERMRKITEKYLDEVMDEFTQYFPDKQSVLIGTLSFLGGMIAHQQIDTNNPVFLSTCIANIVNNFEEQYWLRIKESYRENT